MAVTCRLHDLRKSRKWTQAELAAFAGVSRQTINSIEAGRFEASLGLALRLARLLEVPVEDIFQLPA
jgi:putative transcriptional regulator